MPEWINKKAVFNLTGALIVIFWLVMIGLLVKKIHFQGRPERIDHARLAGTIRAPRRDWKEIYLHDKKVGYSVSLVKPFKDGYFIHKEIFLKLNLMGFASGLYTVTQCRVNDKFFLKSFTFSMTSGAVRFTLSGRVEGDRLILTTGKGKEKRTSQVRLERPPMIGAGMEYFFKSREISVGDTFHLPVFDPSTMSQKEVAIKVVASEPVKIHGIKYDAFRLEAEMWGKLLTFWLDKDGTTLKEEGFMGLTTVRSSAASAPEGVEGSGEVDFYELTAIAVDRKLPHPDRLNYLKVRFDGIDNVKVNRDAWDGGRQRFRDGVMEITREKPDSRVSYEIPFKENNGEMKSFLKPEFNIESDDKEIIEKARRIAGGDVDSLSVAGKLLKWVYNNLEKRPVMSIPSAREVLRTMAGDCNEHATLLTALLRALKIPARLCVGIVYTRGKFFYHAWTEAYTGEWVTLDATLNQIAVDATHIKLLEGNLDRQVEIVGLIGNLKLKVLEYR